MVGELGGWAIVDSEDPRHKSTRSELALLRPDICRDKPFVFVLVSVRNVLKVLLGGRLTTSSTISMSRGTGWGTSRGRRSSSWLIT